MRGYSVGFTLPVRYREHELGEHWRCTYRGGRAAQVRGLGWGFWGGGFCSSGRGCFGYSARRTTTRPAEGGIYDGRPCQRGWERCPFSPARCPPLLDGTAPLPSASAFHVLHTIVNAKGAPGYSGEVGCMPGGRKSRSCRRDSRSRRVVDSGMGSPMSPSGIPVFEMIARVIEVGEHFKV